MMQSLQRSWPDVHPSVEQLLAAGDCPFCRLDLSNIMRRVVVCHLGARGVAVILATHRAACVCEPAKVLCMDRLVALQHSNGFVNVEPLPLPSCETWERQGPINRQKCDVLKDSLSTNMDYT